MKRLVCEMCGGSDILKEDGVFVCQNCGVKYTVEEARKMMIEGTVSVTGTIKVDNTDQIKNFLEMARSAYEASNKSEAEAYCNRIIEIDSKNADAWFIKGQAAGWQSSIANLRFEESVQCFSKAIDHAEGDKKKEYQKSASKEMSDLSTALITMACDNFQKYQSESTAKTVIDCASKAKLYALKLFIKCSITPDKYENEVATMIYNAAVSSLNHFIIPEYKNNNKGHPSHSAFTNLLDKSGYCASLIKTAINFSEEDDLADIPRYESLIEINNYCIKACSWKEEYGYTSGAAAFFGGMASGMGGSDGQKWHWVKEYSLNASAIASREKENNEYRSKIIECRENAVKKEKEKKRLEAEKRAKEAEDRRIKQEEQKKKNEMYWAEHDDERNQLKSERNKLLEEWKALQKKLEPYENQIRAWKTKKESDTPSINEKKNIERRVKELDLMLSDLSVFQIKAKKKIETEFNELCDRLPAINKKIEEEKKALNKRCDDKLREIEQKAKPIRDEANEKQKRIDEINAEFNKNR